MKKIVLAVVLLGVLFGIVFIKTGRDQAKVDEAFQQGVAKAQLEVTVYQKRLESLRVAGDQTRLAWSDSVRVRDSILTHYKDSTSQIIIAQADRIKELQRKARPSMKSAPKSGATATAVKNDATAPPIRHAQILTYYKNRYRELPVDLSAYERKAALSEIRQETATKFSVTLTELNEIRKTYKLDY
jgi:uncharacterized protein YciW